MESLILLTAFWTVYFFLHSFLATLKVKNLAEKKLPGLYKYYRLCYSLFSTLAFILIFWYQASISSPLIFQASFLAITTGWGLISGGLIIGLLTLKNYDGLLFLGVRQALDQKKNQTLSTGGVNGIVRHPLYLGTMLVIAGFFILKPTPPNLIFLVATLVYLLIAIPLEEKKLVLEYGEEYRQYQKRVKMLIPFIY